MALPVKGWPKHIGRGLRKKGGHLLFLERFNQAWKPLTFESQADSNSFWWSTGVPAVDGPPPVRYRQGLLESSRNPPLTRAAMTRRQIAWIISQNQPEKQSFPCYDMCSNTTNGYNDDDADFNDLYYEDDDDDVIGARYRIPYMTAETECTLEAPYLDFGVSVTISGHRFIALSKETSWIDKCKACGKTDAVEFITRCGSQRLCSRQCVQMFVRHRRYRRQIHEKPLFVQPLTCNRSDQMMAVEEIVSEGMMDPMKKKKRTYTKRKMTSSSAKETTSSSRGGGKDGNGEKPAKRAYNKKSAKKIPGLPKLKVKMQMKKKKCRGHEADIDTDSDSDADEIIRSKITNLSRDDEHDEGYVGAESVNHDHHPKTTNGKSKGKRRERSRKQDFPAEQVEDYHVCSIMSLSRGSSNVSEEDLSMAHHTASSDTAGHTAAAGIKLGRVKIELKKCGGKDIDA